MGKYLNPGNDKFKSILRSNYVDKTGLIEYLNGTIDTANRMTCFSRPRRFGKSFAAKMLEAYYDKSCDSRELFEGLEISRSESFTEYLNKFDVISIDVTGFISWADDIKNVVSDIKCALVRELRETFPDLISDEDNALQYVLPKIVKKTGVKFFIIIDEWDALFREAKDDDALQKEYIQLLRGLFKNGNMTDGTIAGAYMTGILPLKKYGTQSALTDFREFSIDRPFMLSKYVGFTENEVRALCDKSGMDFGQMKRWYDGYTVGDYASVYNPNSVMQAINMRTFDSYWTKTESYDSLRDYITMNIDGVKDAIVTMLGGQRVDVDAGAFRDDFVTFRRRDDVLTLLIHLGYLAYDAKNEEVHIPNLEIAREFKTAVTDTDWSEVVKLLQASERLIKSTIAGDAEEVAQGLDLAHETLSSILKYNDENCLACAMRLAYYTAINYYRVIRELPTGKGYADIVFLPYKNTDKPAMVIELKHDKDADTAIRQIKERRYTGALAGYEKEILLVGVNYDKETKKHEAVIEWWNMEGV